jgi:hypothetical protein
VDALALPYFLAGLLVPHATLLYWASNSGFQYSLQRALAQPRVAAALKLKSPLTEARSAQEASGRCCSMVLGGSHTTSTTGKNTSQYA